MSQGDVKNNSYPGGQMQQQQQYGGGYGQPAPGYGQQPAMYGQGYPNVQVVMAPQAINTQTHLCWSVVSTILLCLPLGIAAIIMSCLAGTDFQEGRLAEGAQKASTARVLNIIATVFGVLAWIVGIILIIVAATTISALLPSFG